MTQPTTNEWELYQRGLEYNNRLGYKDMVSRNERFYAGEQWEGVQAKDMPKPVFNILKRVTNYFIASIMSNNIKMQLSADMVGDDPENPQDQAVKSYVDTINAYFESCWEDNKIPAMLRDILQDMANSGDGAAHCFFDASIDTGQDAQGAIETELVDGINVFFGNPNDRRAQKQPYILISYRQLVQSLREEARASGVGEDDVLQIVADADYEDQAGDRSKIEIDSKDDENGKATAVIKYWRDAGTKTIWWTKSVKHTVIRASVDSKQKLYPVTWNNWDKRKNSYHGQALITGLIPNQLFINKMFALVMLCLMKNAFPKVLYSSTVFPNGLSNTVGENIAADAGVDIRNAVHVIEGQAPTQMVMSVIDAAINYTKDMLGASDAALGDVKPDNTSAIIAVQKAAAVPLESIKANLYQFVEDMGYIWLDIMAAKYGQRAITVTIKGQRQVVMFDFEQLGNLRLKLKIDVGPSTYWSEITALQTLDNLLTAEKISFVQYLDRLPNGIIPKKEELVEEVQAQIEQQNIIPMIIQRLQQLEMEGVLPPGISQEIIPPEMMGGGGMVA